MVNEIRLHKLWLIGVDLSQGKMGIMYVLGVHSNGAGTDHMLQLAVYELF